MSWRERVDPKERNEIEALEKPDPEKKVSYTLGGTAVTESGKLTKSNYFRFLQHNLDDYDHIQLSPEEAKKIHQHLLKLSTGATAMTPMYCAGPKCPFADRCPLQLINKAPIGKQCLIEVQLMKEWIMRYFEEFDVDPNNFTEVGYVNELADLMVLEMRINMNLAKAENSNLIVDQTIGVDRDGDPIIQKAISPFMEMKERLANRRSKIIKLMVGDRQEKYKKEAALKIKMDADPSMQMANLRGKLESLKRELDNVSKELPKEAAGHPKLNILSPQDVFADDKE
jgi:hypothetical protein